MRQGIYNPATVRFRQNARDKGRPRGVKGGRRIKRASSETKAAKNLRRADRAMLLVVMDDSYHLGKVLGFPRSAIRRSIEARGAFKTRSLLEAAKHNKEEGRPR